MTKFCLSVDIHDVITCATFYDDRLRGLGVARGRISRVPIDLRRRKSLTQVTHSSRPRPRSLARSLAQSLTLEMSSRSSYHHACARPTTLECGYTFTWRKFSKLNIYSDNISYSLLAGTMRNIRVTVMLYPTIRLPPLS